MIVFQVSAALTSLKTRACAPGLLAAAAVAGALAFAAPAAATEVFVYSASPTSSQFGTTVEDISAEHPDRSFFGMAPQVVHAKEGTQFSAGADFTVLAFCIDFYTDTPMDNYDMDTGLNPINYQYERGPLSGAQLGADPDAEAKIGRLINYGTLMWNYHAHNEKLEVQLAAIQGAIWQIQTGLTFQFHPFFDPKPQWNTLIQNYANLSIVPAGVSQGEIKALFSGDGGSQAVAYAIRADVPEPATWGLMILGFFGAGSMLRKSRRRISTAG
jgi:hypothetical protein